jgi:hypothetical protein
MPETTVMKGILNQRSCAAGKLVVQHQHGLHLAYFHDVQRG